jgi:hypothetical protein
MDWTTAWQLAGEICDLLAESGINTTARQHEQIANLLQTRNGQRFNSYSQIWTPDPYLRVAVIDEYDADEQDRAFEERYWPECGD